MSSSVPHENKHTYCPDVETSSEGYASRFSGAVGKFFLKTQLDTCLEMLSYVKTNSAHPLQILEVGGGHCQLTEPLLKAGHKVTVHGSALSCKQRLEHLQASHPNSISFVVSDLYELPFAAKSFDVVIALRLLPHLERTEEFVIQLCRLAKQQVIFDYAPLVSFNILAPLLFPIKKLIEKNTRQYFCHRLSDFRPLLQRELFTKISSTGQFVIPMGLHRAMNNVDISCKAEQICKQWGITQLLGSPRILSARSDDT